MAENTKIEWADHTWNFAWGCVEVSPACAHCYAKLLARRIGLDIWGADKPRRIFGEEHFAEPLRWNRRPWVCESCGRIDDKQFDHSCTGRKEDACHTDNVNWHRARVFCSSMADIGEDYQGCSEAELECQRALLNSPSIKLGGKREFDESRQKTWALIEATPNLDWLLLTKRPENMLKIVPEHWRNGFPPNVWMGTTLENQDQEERVSHLLRIPAKVRFLSCEPLLGNLEIEEHLEDLCDGGYVLGSNQIHWVICGGESGPNARPMHPQWARSLRDQCQAAGVPFFFKQWGEHWPVDQWEHEPERILPHESAWDDHPKMCRGDDNHLFYRFGKKAAGRLLDGRAWNEFPVVGGGK